jgi:hypothetical protein
MKNKNTDEEQNEDCGHHPKDDKNEAKLVTIVVNARQVEVEKKKLSFDEVVKIAFDHPATGPNVLFTISYFKGHGEKPEGSMVQGDTVKVKEGMVFNVAQTDKS